MGKQNLRALVRDILAEELRSLLGDISYRLGVLYDAERGGRFGSRDLNLAVHQIDGFTVTDNSPSAGFIAWADVNIAYKGTNYAITNGDSNKKYIYWKLNTTPTTLQSSDTKPVLTDDDVLVFINDGGLHQTVISAGRMTHGASILTGTVGSGEVADAAIGTAKLAAFAVDGGKLADSAVTADKLAGNSVTNAKIADGAVTGPKIGAGSVATDKLNTALHMIF